MKEITQKSVENHGQGGSFFLSFADKSLVPSLTLEAFSPPSFAQNPLGGSPVTSCYLSWKETVSHPGLMDALLFSTKIHTLLWDHDGQIE